MIRNHEIDYHIFGEEMQYVEVELDPGETAVAEPGAFMMMDDGIQMETLFVETLVTGELLKIDTSCIVGFTYDVDYDIQFIGGIKNTIFGGEGLFFATLRGPGKVWIQTLPVSRLASRILAYGTVQRKEEGSILGGLGNLLDGDGY